MFENRKEGSKTGKKVRKQERMFKNSKKDVLKLINSRNLEI